MVSRSGRRLSVPTVRPNFAGDARSTADEAERVLRECARYISSEGWDSAVKDCADAWLDFLSAHRWAEQQREIDGLPER